MTTADTSQTAAAPTLASIRALLAMLARLIFRPGAETRVASLFAEIEDLIAARLLHLALADANHPYRTADMYEARFIWRGAIPEIDIRLRPGAVHPLHAIIANRRLARRIGFVRRALGRRTRFSRKLSYLHFRNQRRRHATIITRAASRSASPRHTPARIAAPP